MRWCMLLALALACGPRASRPRHDESAPWGRSGVDWSKPPPVVTVPWAPPAISETTLANGVRVIVVENRRLPLVSIVALNHAAGSREDVARPGLAALTVDALDEDGTLARTLDRQGTRIDATIATDHSSLELVARAHELRPALGVLADILRQPTLSDADILRVRAVRAAELTEQRGQTRRLAAQVFDRVVFGLHPYAEPAEGTAASMAVLTGADVRAFWQRAYRPDALTLVVAGDTTAAQARDAITAAFGNWTTPSTPRSVVPALPAYSAQLAYVDVPGATEANVIVGRRAAGAGDPHQLAADIANSIVGGGTQGRLDRELHGKRQLTFGASSSFWRGELGGSWAAASTFGTERAPEGIRTLVALLAAAPAPDEIVLARRNLLGAAQLSFETTLGSVRAVARLVTQRQPLDAFATLAARLEQTTPASLPANDLSIVVVGDWSKLAEPLRSLGQWQATATQHVP